jgi:hypothetical protein
MPIISSSNTPFFQTNFPVSTFKTFPLFFKSHSKYIHSHKNTAECDSELFLVNINLSPNVRHQIPPLSSDFSLIMYSANNITGYLDKLHDKKKVPNATPYQKCINH